MLQPLSSLFASRRPRLNNSLSLLNPAAIELIDFRLRLAISCSSRSLLILTSFGRAFSTPTKSPWVAERMASSVVLTAQHPLFAPQLPMPYPKYSRRENFRHSLRDPSCERI